MKTPLIFRYIRDRYNHLLLYEKLQWRKPQAGKEYEISVIIVLKNNIYIYIPIMVKDLEELAKGGSNTATLQEHKSDRWHLS